MRQHVGSGKIQTVLGLVDMDQAGLTLTHEHLLSDFRCLIPRDEWDTNNGRNFLKDNVNALIREVAEFKKAGGGTLVDVTPLKNPGRHPDGLVRVAKETGVNIVMGVSYYTEPFYTPDMDMDGKTAEEIAYQYLHEITDGVGDTDVKPGILGEAGCSWPLTKNEFKCLHAAAITQIETGFCISIHPGSSADSPMEILSVLISFGVDPERIILGHMEDTLPPEAGDARMRLAKQGCYLSFDLFAVPDGALQPFARHLADDGRIDQIQDLARHGFVKQILLSHDSLTVELMAVNGGPGIVHIPNTVIPLMRSRGFSEKDIHTITVENPARALAVQ